jgi:hypothetical protein
MRVILLAGLLLTIGNAPGLAQEDAEGQENARERSTVAVVLSEIEIDGDLGDWPDSIAIEPIGQLLTKDPLSDDLGTGGLGDLDLSANPDLSAVFATGYDPDEQLLYLAVIVRDDVLVIGHKSHLDTDAVEVYIDGLHSDRRVPYSGNPEPKASDMPVQQYIGIAGEPPVYGRAEQNNPVLFFGDITKTRTRMAHRRDGDVTVYEWAIEPFDRVPDEPTALAPGKRIGFDIAIADRDAPITTPDGRDEPEENRLAWIYWGPEWKGMKILDAGSLGELVLAEDPDR